jgi:hypothetical protein
MSRGPAPKPTSQLDPSGWRRAKREKTEPKAEPGEPEMPGYMSVEAKGLWPTFVSLMPTGVLTKSDGWALAKLCDAEAGYRRVLVLYQAERNVKLRSKLRLELAEERKWVAYWMARFGLSPSDRSRIVVRPDGAAGDAAVLKFFGGEAG